MRETVIREYDLEDMKALEEMSMEEVDFQLKKLDRGYFNRFVFPKEGEVYSEDQYEDYAMRCALRKLYDIVEKLKAEEMRETVIRSRKI